MKDNPDRETSPGSLALAFTHPPRLEPLEMAFWSGFEQRSFLIKKADAISRPALQAMAEGRSHQLELRGRLDRAPGTHVQLEAFGRIAVSLSGWLGSPLADGASTQERSTHHQLRELFLAGLSHGIDAQGKDFWNWEHEDQVVVDAAKVGFAVLTAPDLFASLSVTQRKQLRTCLEQTRAITPHFNNWLLFSALIECAIGALEGRSDWMRVEYAVRQFDQWYVGDSFFKDGVEFHMDYYNSLVIHPFLTVCLERMRDFTPNRFPHEALQKQYERLTRHAEILERLISPEGTFPPIGRSLGYRCGVFFTLAFVATRQLLSESLKPSQVRCALTAVIERFVNHPELQRADGLLNAGFIGNQPSQTEYYLQDSAAYLMLYPFSVLALAPKDPFWADESTAWTSLQLWSGGSVPVDHALGHHLRAATWTPPQR